MNKQAMIDGHKWVMDKLIETRFRKLASITLILGLLFFNVNLSGNDIGHVADVNIELSAVGGESDFNCVEMVSEPSGLLDDLAVNCNVNLALGGTVNASSIAFGGLASRIIDDNTNGNYGQGSVAHTGTGSANEWLEVDLGSVQPIGDIVLWNRTNACCDERLSNALLMVSSTPFPDNTNLLESQNNASFSQFIGDANGVSNFNVSVDQPGRYIRVQKSGIGNEGGNALNIAELQVFGSCYTLSTDALNGTIDADPLKAEYDADEVITLTSTPDFGYVFDSWSGDASGNTNPLQVTMDGDKNVTANFTNLSAIELQENTGGYCVTDAANATIDSDQAGYTGSGYANTANAVGAFLEWAVNVDETGPYQVRWRYANAPASNRTGRVVVNGLERVPSQDFTSTGSWSIWDFTTTTINLVQGNNLIRLESNTASGLANIDRMDIAGNGTVSFGNCASDPGSDYSLNTLIEPLEGGTIVLDPAGGIYEAGTTVSATAIPADGYILDTWSGDASGNSTSIQLNMDSDKTITANFIQQATYTLTTSGVPAQGGTIILSPSGGIYTEGTIVTITIIEAEGYRFDNWRGASTSSDITIELTMDADKSLTALLTQLCRWRYNDVDVAYFDCGDVGIGTNVPEAKLDVRGITKLGSLTEPSFVEVKSQTQPEVRFTTPTSEQDMRIGVADQDIAETGAKAGDLYISSETSVSAPVVVTKTGNVVLVSESGKVGIGTYNIPEEYTLAVDGTIGARKVKVETQNWADYVFEKNYNLLPLSFVEAFIAKHGHLPNVDPADKVIQDGIDLGEMNVKLMEKIEELTLYIIEQDKRLKALEKMVTEK